MGFLQNPWFVGIATGLISGVLVFFLTKWIMDKKGKTEYYKQVKAANSSVIGSLKPYVADKGLPELEVFKALIASTSRLFNVDEKDMYSISLYCEELIREIISDVYVSNEKKAEYTKSLAEYKANINNREKELKLSEMKLVTGQYNEKMKSRVSMYLAVMASFISLLGTLFFTSDKELIEGIEYISDTGSILLIPIMLLLIMFSLLAMLFMSETLLKVVKRKTTKSDNKTE